jgi:hypothetical protein
VDLTFTAIGTGCVHGARAANSTAQTIGTLRLSRIVEISLPIAWALPGCKRLPSLAKPRSHWLSVWDVGVEVSASANTALSQFLTHSLALIEAISIVERRSLRRISVELKTRSHPADIAGTDSRL